MSLVGYACVSTAEGRQVLDRQLDALNAAGCERVFEDHASGAAPDRPSLAACLDYLRRGDVLVVLDLDRLGRRAGELISLIDELDQRGIGFRALNSGSIKIRGVKVADIDGRTSKRRPRTPVRLSDGGRFRRLTPRILMLPWKGHVQVGAPPLERRFSAPPGRLRLPASHHRQESAPSTPRIRDPNREARGRKPRAGPSARGRRRSISRGDEAKTCGR